MADLSDLHKSVSVMSDEELLEHFRTIRLARRTSPQRAPRAATKAKPKQKDIAVSDISAADAAALLELLGGLDE